MTATPWTPEHLADMRKRVEGEALEAQRRLGASHALLVAWFQDLRDPTSLQMADGGLCPVSHDQFYAMMARVYSTTAPPVEAGMSSQVNAITRSAFDQLLQILRVLSGLEKLQVLSDAVGLLLAEYGDRATTDQSAEAGELARKEGMESFERAVRASLGHYQAVFERRVVTVLQ